MVLIHYFCAMRRLFVLVFCAFVMLATAACQSGGTKGESPVLFDASDQKPITDTLTNDPAHYAVFSVSDTLHDFGSVQQGAVVAYAFRFKNTGSRPLVIREASSTCGCTVPEYPKEPIAPGAEGRLKVVFNSAGKSGRQLKPVFIQANTKPSTIQLAITCDVVATNHEDQN